LVFYDNKTFAATVVPLLAQLPGAPAVQTVMIAIQTVSPARQQDIEDKARSHVSGFWISRQHPGFAQPSPESPSQRVICTGGSVALPGPAREKKRRVGVAPVLRRFRPVVPQVDLQDRRRFLVQPDPDPRP
jgi:hypothetical protein